MDKYWFVFIKSELLLEKTSNGNYTIPLQENPPIAVDNADDIHNITPLGDIEVKTYNSGHDNIDTSRYELCGLRASYNKLTYELYLKGNRIAEGQKSYSQVIGLLISCEKAQESSNRLNQPS